MLQFFLGLIPGLAKLLGPQFAQSAVEAYRAKLDSENSKDKIAADLAAREAAIAVERQALDNQRLAVEGGRWWRAAPQFTIEITVAAYIAKLGLDKITGTGFTAAPGDTFGAVMQIVLVGIFGGSTVITATAKLARFALRPK